MGTGRPEYDVGVLSEKSDEVYCDLEVATEEEQNSIDVGEVCLTVQIYVDVCSQGKEY